MYKISDTLNVLNASSKMTLLDLIDNDSYFYTYLLLAFKQVITFEAISSKRIREFSSVASSSNL